MTHVSSLAPRQGAADATVWLPAAIAVAAIAGYLHQAVQARQALLFAIGLGLGLVLLHAAFGFSGGWRALIREGRGRAVRGQLLLLALSSLLFFPVLAGLLPGTLPHGAYAPAGVSVLVGAFLFGVGMQLGGGCGSGTLFTVGGGHVRMLITLAFFIVGAVLGTIHLPWWLSLPNLGKVSLIARWGWLPAMLAQLLVLALLYLGVRRWERRRRGNTEPLFERLGRPWRRTLTAGPWPLWWGAVGLALLGLATLLVAGYPWSITFAFGLWGTKLWAGLGGDISGWEYWAHGYPALALQRSVLLDGVSVMDFGVILGALLAAGMAGSFAPPTQLQRRDVLSAVAGGLLLGYGARLAFGCNIGGLLAGIASGSLHGWLWLLAGFPGAMVGVALRARFGMDAPREDKA
jgi:uncharacterized membrane protein YedE/YeeE